MIAAEQELYRACEVLFGLDLDRISRDFLEYVQLSGIKTAYRKKARETHPDSNFGASDLVQRRCADEFRAVQQSYEQLTKYLDAREKGFRFPLHDIRAAQTFSQRPRRPATSETWKRSQTSGFYARNGGKPFQGGGFAKPPPHGDGRASSRKTNGATAGFAENDWGKRYYQGNLPDRKLLLGHYLYYAGVVTWRDIIQALVWQRTQRPRLGEIGTRFGWMKDEDILQVLKNRQPFQTFGQSARALGLISEAQLNTMIYQQKRLQRKIGDFFVENRIITPEKFRRLLAEYRQHNFRQENDFSGR